VDIKHCDISAILLELQGLQGLRSDVRDIANVQAEVVLLQNENVRLKQEMSALRSELPALRGEIDNLVSWQTEQSTYQVNKTCSQSLSSLPLTVSAVPTAASVVSAAISAGALQQPVKRRPKFAVGSSDRNKLHPAMQMKPVSIFVSRLHPDTVCNDIVSCVTDTLKDTLNLSAPRIKITCEQLKTKFDSYASFYVIIIVEEVCKRDVIDLLMSSDGWPKGVLVRKFFINKHHG